MRKSIKQRIGAALFIALLSSVVCSQSAIAGDYSMDKISKSVKVLQFGKALKVRGFQIAEGVYMGQAKVAGKYGLGVIVDRKTYAWGFNHRGVSISKRF